MIAALFVETGGVYFGLPDVDPWDIDRDARNYDGPWPVVAHPPCNVWCQLASVNRDRWGAPYCEDGGLFESALASVRRWGGVLEHPAYSLAWYRYGLPIPMRGGWVTALDDPGMSTEVSQVQYGHAARKRTWLYAVGIDPAVMDWGEQPAEMVIGAAIHTRAYGGPRMMAATLDTPIAFRDALIELAQTAGVPA